MKCVSRLEFSKPQTLNPLTMRRLELFFLVARVPLDFAAIFLAALSAYFLRFGTVFADWRPATQIISFSNYLAVSLFVSVIWTGILAASGIYGTSRPKFLNEIFKIVVSLSTGFAAVIFFLFFKREFFASRFILLAGWLLAIIFVVLAHLAMRSVRRYFYRRGIGLRRAALIGAGRTAAILLESFKAHPELGVAIAFNFAKISDRGFLSEIDEIIYADEVWNTDAFSEVAKLAEEKHLSLKYAADFWEGPRSSVDVTALFGVPLVELKKTPLEGWARVVKRIFDLILSAFLLILFSPLFLLIVLAVKFGSKGPIIFKNTRVGQYGRIFNTLKFRTMKSEYCIGPQFSDSEKNLELEKELISKQGIKNGPVYKIKNDPRVTMPGRMLRATSLDELPQLWNVLRGEMSLVGPRPHQPREVENYNRDQKRIFLIKPGITGLAQISGRSDLSFGEESRLDIYYMEHWRISLDLIIIFKTILAVLRGRGAY